MIRTDSCGTRKKKRERLRTLLYFYRQAYHERSSALVLITPRISFAHWHVWTAALFPQHSRGNVFKKTKTSSTFPTISSWLSREDLLKCKYFYTRQDMLPLCKRYHSMFVLLLLLLLTRTSAIMKGHCVPYVAHIRFCYLLVLALSLSCRALAFALNTVSCAFLRCFYWHE